MFSEAHSSSIGTAPTEPPAKRCGCGLAFSLEAWSQLQYLGVQHIPEDETGPAERLTCRNCTCGSTLALPETVEEYRARVEGLAGRGGAIAEAGRGA